MHTYQNADADPHITPASRWLRSGAVFLGTLALFGIVGSLYGKKPVKPPPEPEPPPITESGLLYIHSMDPYAISVVDISSADWTPVELFSPPGGFALGDEYALEGDLVPSMLDHSGRWFAAVQGPVVVAKNVYGSPVPYSLYGYPEGASPYGENSHGVSPFLVAVDETGTVVRLNTEDDLYELNHSSQPYWFAGDTRILFLARKVIATDTVEASTEESKWNPEPEVYTKTYLEPVAGSGGLYIAKVSWVDGVPALEGPPEILEWSRGLWPDNDYHGVDSFAVTQDGSTLFLNRSEVPFQWPPSLHKLDLLTGQNDEVLATGLGNMVLNRGETRIYGNGSDPDYPHSVIQYVDLHSPGPPETVDPPSADMGCWDAVVAPSDQTLAFGQRTTIGKMLRNPEIGISDLSGTATGVVYDDRAFLLGWRTSP